MMVILRNNQKKMLEIKTLKQMQNAFDGLISTRDVTEEENSELEYKQKIPKINKTSKKCGRVLKYVTYIIGISEEESENEAEINI